MNCDQHDQLTKLSPFGFLAAVLIVLFCLPEPAQSEGISPETLSFRGRVSEANTLGKPQPEEFQAFDLSADFDLPWRADLGNSGYLGGRLMASVGTISASETTALVLSGVPKFRLATQGDRFYFDAGAGGALFSGYKFGEQDFGGHFQFALTLGTGVSIYRGLGLGYRFMHYSDASMHGSGTTGADLHMIELIYQFQ